MKIAVFCSGNGSNFQAIIDAVKAGEIHCRIALMVCDNPKAFALKRAHDAGIRTFVLEKAKYKERNDFERAILAELEKHEIDFIALAGFMKILSADFIRAYPNKILNVHPALLPQFKGAHAIKDALESRVTETGVTIHFVDEGVDTGPIILQETVPIDEGETLETLEAKIHRVEHKLYPKAIACFAENRLKIENGKVLIK